MQLFKCHAADNGQNNSIYQYREGRIPDAHHGCFKLQATQNSTVTSNRLIMQNEEPKKVESGRFYSIPNPTDTSRTMQTGELYQGNL